LVEANDEHKRQQYATRKTKKLAQTLYAMPVLLARFSESQPILS
jgi:hypothetical protein